MRRLVKLIIVSIAAGLLTITPALAQTYGELKGQLGEADRKAAEAHSQIQNFDEQIARIEAQVIDTRSKIEVVNTGIADAQNRMAAKKVTLKEHLQDEYKRSQTSDIEILAGSKSLSDFFDKQQYVETSRDKLTEAISEILKLKKQLDRQKAELSKLNEQLVSAQNGLAYQKSLKVNELAGIEAARASLKDKLSKMRNQGMPLSGERVSKGEVIGFEGTSGCSTGSHVHFEVQVNGTPVNPRSKMGAMQMPHAGYVVSQEFGRPNWSAPYDFHSGIDISEYFGAPVLAAADGVVIFSGYDRSGFGDHVKIDHGGGVVSIYGHMGARGSDYPNC